MADIQSAMDALRKADAAGNVEDARRLAGIVQQLRSVPEPKKETTGMMPFVNKALAGIAAPVDFVTKGLAEGISLIPGVNYEEPLSLRKGIESGMKAIGATLPEEGQEPKTMPEYIGRGVGEVASFMIPAGAGARLLSRGTGLVGNIAKSITSTMVKHPYVTMTSELTAGIGAGTGRGVAETEEMGGPGTKSMLEMGGGIVGGMAPTAMAYTPTAMAIKTGKALLRKVSLPFSKAGAKYRAGEFLKTHVADPARTIPKIGEKTIGDLPPSIQSGEKRLITLYKSLVGQDPATDAEAIEDLSKSIIFLEKEMRKMGYGSPEVLAEITQKRIAALELNMDNRVLSAMEGAQVKLDALPVAQRKVHESRIVRTELETVMKAEKGKERELWGEVSKDFKVGLEKTRQSFRSIVDDLSDAQTVDIPLALKKNAIITDDKLNSTTLREMQGLRSKLLETSRKARMDGQWNKARIADNVSDAILEDLGIASKAKGSRMLEAYQIVKNRRGQGSQVPIADVMKEMGIKDVKDIEPLIRQGLSDGSIIGTKASWTLGEAATPGAIKKATIGTGDFKISDIAVKSGSIEETITPEAASLRAALASTRQFKTRFESGVVGKILGYSKSGAPAIDPDLTLDISIGRMGATGSIDVEKVAITPDAIKATERYLARSYTDYAMDSATGKINPLKSDRWIKNNEAILDKFPALRTQMTDISGSQELATTTKAAMEARKATLRDPKISTSARFLNSADLNREVETVLKAKNPMRMAFELAQQARKDVSGEALEGLRGGFVDYMLEKSSIGAFNELGEQTLSGRTLLAFVNRNVGTLSPVFTPEQIFRMRRVGSELAKIETFEKMIPGKGEIEMKDVASNALRMFARIAGARLGGIAGRESPGGSLQMAQIGSSRFKTFMNYVTKNRAENLIHDAILSKDPKLLSALLAPIDKPFSKGGQANLKILDERMNLWLGGTGKRVFDDIMEEIKNDKQGEPQ